MGHDHSSILSSLLWDILFISISCLAIGFYIFSVLTSNKKLHLHRWPLYRTAFWIFGVIMALLVMVGPLATMAHFDFRFRMLGHWRLGMLSPLFLVLAAPMTLVLRTLPVTTARKLTKVMRQRPISFITHPITASLLNIGGLWVLYTTPLFQWMHQHTWLYVLIHLHIILAGYVFTAAMIYIDPAHIVIVSCTELSYLSLH